MNERSSSESLTRPLERPGPDPADRSAGVALVITLAMLVLLSAIVVAFFTTVTTDVASSKNYQGSVNARMLADSAVNLVIGEIKDASTQPNQAWISQPGLIRTYGQTGQPLSAYKLYSSDQLVVDATTFNPLNNADDVPTTGAWRNQTALWTDLNSAVTDPTRHDALGNPLMTYPILDGNHLYATTDPSTRQTVGALALSESGTPDIAGFEMQSFDKSHPAEMPVKWLYILKDGTIVSAALGTAGNSAQLNIPANKTTTPEGERNEPVARIAYWTDDESAKVNINTASEGTFWDTPICNSERPTLLPKPPLPGQVDPNLMYEMDLAEYIPDQNEYQRYPGHPATTCLSPIFGQQLSKLYPYRPNMIEAIFQMIPRIGGSNYSGNPQNPFPTPLTDYSSDGGTRRGGKGNVLATDNTPYPIVCDNDRLYANLDEFLFSPVFGGTTPNQRNRQQLAPQSSTSTTDNTREMLEMAKFFLTAQSRAPEQNLFNKPRVAIWPIDISPANRTTFDNTIAFCSTVGPVTDPTNPPYFIFTRTDPTSPTADYSARNQRVYSYLQSLMALPFPGYALKTSSSTTLAAKYGTDSDQILTEVYDYIRCTNMIDMTLPVNETYTNKNGQDMSTQLTKRGQVVPITIGNTRGLGRIATISELALVFAGLSDSAGSGSASPTEKIEVALLPQLFCPMAGFSALANDIRIHFSDINITVVDPSGNVVHPFNAKQPDIYDVGRITDVEDGESKVGGVIGARSLLEGGTATIPRWPLDVGSPPDSVPPTGEFTVTGAKGALMSFYGDVTVQIYAPNGNLALGKPPTQTIRFNFGSAPGIRVPIPSLTPGGTSAPFADGPGAATKLNSTRCAGQFNSMFTSTDTVRSSCPVGGNGTNGGVYRGDMRLVAAMSIAQTVPKVKDGPIFIVPAKQASQTSQQLTHSMRPCYSPQGGMYPGFQGGSLVATIPSANYQGPWDLRPAIPIDVNGVQNSMGGSGDWDNGPHFVLDGPLCNKADEGGRRHEHGRGQVTGQYDEDSAPYIGWPWNPQDAVTEQSTFFSPNRQIASPVTFGSLPTGVRRGLPWQTLLFRPAKSYFPGGAGHPGSALFGPPDHLLLDLFWMPVVEPYPISEPFSTAGKINLNAQVVPFTNIVRTTGLRAVLQAVKVAALNPTQPDSYNKVNFVQDYKECGSPGAGGGGGGGYNVIVRRNVDVDNTVREIQDRLNQNKPFISASEICDIPLIPANVTGQVNTGITDSTPVSSFDGELSSFWKANSLTGDNTLERPYSYIYPRLTTRSNTYTVHVHVQTLKQAKRTTQTDQFIDGKDQVTGDFRGSFVVERYLDPNSAGFYRPDGTASNEQDQQATLGPYRFRVLTSKQFAP